MYTAVPFTGKTTTEVQFAPTVLRFFLFFFFFFKNCLLDKLIDEFTVLNKTFGEQLKVANKEYFKNDSLVLMRSLKSSF